MSRTLDGVFDDLIYFFFYDAGDGNQGLEHARQAQ